MLQIKSLSKSYAKDKFAINDCSIHIENNKIYGLLGENGSGKTTLLRLIAGVLKQDSGIIEFQNQFVYENPTAKQEIIFVSDDLYFENKATLKKLKKEYEIFYPNFNQDRYRQLLQIFNLDENKEITTFSKGGKRQAALVLGLSIDCQLFLIDETFDGLDLKVRYDLKRFLMGLIEEKEEFSVIISSHNLLELENICDEILILEDGKLIVHSNLEDLKTKICRVNVVFNQGFEMELDVKYHESNGKIQTFIIQDSEENIDEYLSKLDLVFYEILPCSLEEIFVYEMKGGRINE